MNNKIILLIALSCIFFLSSCDKEQISNPQLYSWERVLDGSSVSVITPSYSTVFDFSIDKYDNLWLGSNYVNSGSWVNGLWQFNGDKWNYLQEFENKYPNPEAFVSDLRFDHKNNLWFGLKNKLVQFDGQQFMEYQIPVTIDTNWLKVFTIEENGRVWLGGDKYFASFLAGNWNVFELPNIDDTWFYDIEVTPNSIWISTRNGLFMHSNNQTHKIDSIQLENNGSFVINKTSEIAQSQNKIYVGTDNGLLVYDELKWNLFNSENSPLKEDYIYSLSNDNEERIYLGLRSGLVRLYNDKWEYFDAPDTPTCSGCWDPIGSIKANSENKIYVLVNDYLFRLKE